MAIPYHTIAIKETACRMLLIEWAALDIRCSPFIRITTHGFPVGAVQDGERVVYNHLNFLVKYHQADHFEGNRVVGFEVKPYSIAHRWRET